MKMIIITGIMFLFLISLATAQTKQIISSNEVLIKDNSSNSLVQYKLNKNTDQCLINCYSEGTAFLFKKGKLFDNLKLYTSKDINRIEKSLFNKILIEKTKQVTYEQKVYNTTGNYTNRNDKVINTYYITENITYWDEYKNEDLESGTYNWRIETNKNRKDNIDWVITSNGVEISDWAWYNNSWFSKKYFTINTSSSAIAFNYTVILNITYNNKMRTDFGDLRFLNSTENGELNYWFYNDSVVSSNYARVYVRLDKNLSSSSNYTMYMYYYNPTATNNSNIANVGLFGDNFNTLDWNKWASTDHTLYSSNNSQLQLLGTATTSKSIVTAENYTNYVLETVASTTSTASSYLGIYTRAPPSGSFDERVFMGKDSTEAFRLSLGGIFGLDKISGTWNLNTKYTFKEDNNFSYVNISVYYPNTTIQSFNQNKSTNLSAGNSTQILKYSNGIGFIDWFLLRTYYVGYNLINITTSKEINNSGVPSVSLISPLNNTNFTNNQITFNCTASDDIGVVNISLYINNIYNITITNTTANQLNLSLQDIYGLNDGINNYTCNVSDGFFTYTNKTYVFLIDTTPPIFNNLRNLLGYTNTSFLQQITASDSNGISQYNFNQSTNFTINRSTGMINNVSLLYGVYTYYLNITANDSFNNNITGQFKIDIINNTGGTSNSSTSTITVSSGCIKLPFNEIMSDRLTNRNYCKCTNDKLTRRLSC
jgi:hypothetical protein